MSDNIKGIGSVVVSPGTRALQHAIQQAIEDIGLETLTPIEITGVLAWVAMEFHSDQRDIFMNRG